MYNGLIQQHIAKALRELGDLEEELGRMSEQGTWMDCSETNEPEVKHLRAAIQGVIHTLDITERLYFVE